MSGMGTNRSKVVKRPPISPWTPSDAQQALVHEAEQQRQRILSMKAGSELDVLVARMMGHEIHTPQPGGLTWERISDTDWVMLRPYSTEAGAAMSVLEQFDWYDVKGTRRGNGRVITVTVGAFDQEGAFWVETTFPLAASKAALLATLEAQPR